VQHFFVRNNFLVHSCSEITEFLTTIVVATTFYEIKSVSRAGEVVVRVNSEGLRVYAISREPGIDHDLGNALFLVAPKLVHRVARSRQETSSHAACVHQTLPGLRRTSSTQSRRAFFGMKFKIQSGLIPAVKAAAAENSIKRS
jgi:hypothetical protein